MKQFISAIRFDRSQHQDYLEYRLKPSSERAPSPFNDTQGDHRTAIGFIKEGFISLLQGLKLDTKDGVDSLKNEKRDQLYDYISAVAAMDTQDRRQELYEGINRALEDYNLVRLRKEHIATLKDKNDPTNREIIQKLREINASQTLGSLSEIYRVFMTFVNQMPNSYVKINEREAPTIEGSRVEQANSFFTGGLTDNSIDESQQQLTESEQKLYGATVRQKPQFTKELEEKQNQHISLLLNTAIEKLSDTFFYLEVPIELLEQHRGKTIFSISETRLKDKFNKDGIRESYIRSNNPADLSQAIAHHLNIAFVRYPELLDQGLSIDEIADKFTDRVIIGSHKIKNNNKTDGDTRKDIEVQGWPSIVQNPELVKQVKVGVKNKLQELHKSLFFDQGGHDVDQHHKKGALHYTSNPRYESVVSSRGSAARSKADSGASKEELGLAEVTEGISLDRYEDK